MKNQNMERANEALVKAGVFLNSLPRYFSEMRVSEVIHLYYDVISRSTAQNFVIREKKRQILSDCQMKKGEEESVTIYLTAERYQICDDIRTAVKTKQNNGKNKGGNMICYKR